MSDSSSDSSASDSQQDIFSHSASGSSMQNKSLGSKGKIKPDVTLEKANKLKPNTVSRKKKNPTKRKFIETPADNPCHSNSDEETDDNENIGKEVQIKDKEDEFALLRQELAQMPFDELEKLKQKIGLKMYKEVMQSGKQKSSMKKTTFKRENKNRPMEISSKKKPPKIRQVIAVKKKLNRDPRFDDLSGKYDEHLFKQSYGFISDVKHKEKIVLLKKIKKEKNEERKQQMQDLLKRMNHQEQSERDKEERAKRLKEIKKKERELVKDGKRPFYLKQSEKKKIELAEKFKELKKSGKMKKYTQKKRKKNASKEKRKLPNI